MNDPVVVLTFHADVEDLLLSFETMQALCAELLVGASIYMEATAHMRHQYRISVPAGSIPVPSFITEVEQALAQRVSIESVTIEDGLGSSN